MIAIETCARCIEDERKARKSAHSKGWADNNKERMRELQRNWCAKNKDKRKEYKLKTRYGITTKEWEEMFSAQERNCAICRSSDPKSKCGCDTVHCHSTGRVRGILCHPCNVMIGQAEDNIETLSNAITYLKKN